jgi:hypothetical protein
MDDRASQTAIRAVVLGHVWVNLPVLAIIAGVSALLSQLIGPPDERRMSIAILMAHQIRLPLGMMAGAALGWIWWSFNVPQWRMWALNHGADEDALQHWAERTRLVWPRGSMFEKTEFRKHPNPKSPNPHV